MNKKATKLHKMQSLPCSHTLNAQSSYANLTHVICQADGARPGAAGGTAVYGLQSKVDH